MAKRLSDTAAIAATPSTPGKSSQTVSTTVRPIDNGFIVEECAYGSDGDYKRTETYSKTAPKLGSPLEKGARQSGGNSLAGAIRAMKE